MNRIDQMTDYPESGVSSLVPDLTQSLDAGLQAIESKFENLGQNLQMVYAESEILTNGIMTSVDSMTDKSKDGLMHHIEAIVNSSLLSLSGCRDTISGSLGRITAGTGHLTQLCSICEKMKKSAAFLNIVGLNIGVEGSRSNEATEMFGDFGLEIKSLAENIGNISETIYSDSKTVQADSLTVHKDITGSMDAFNTLSDSTKQAVQLATQEMETIGQLASRTLEKAGDHSREISRLIGEIVMSIQFHDIARQQVEHIISALNDAVSLLEQQSQDSNEEQVEKADQTKGRVYSVLALQAAQLKQVITEGQQVYENIQSSFEQIGHEVDQLVKNISASRSERGQRADLEQDVKAFQAELEKLLHLLAEGNDLEEKIRKTMDRSSEAVSTLSQYTDQVNNINIDLQYKAINAIIMTSKLGEKGATLEVLAKNVRDLSNESNALVEEVLGIIKVITELSQGAAGPNSAEHEGNTIETASLDIDLAEGISRISDAFEQYQKNSSGAGERSGAIMDTIGNISHELDFFPEWLQGCTTDLETLETLLESLNVWKDFAKDGALDTVDDIALRYTMESERRIHEQLTGKVEEDSGEDEADTVDDILFSDGEKEDELDDNIELF
ncbi:MAG: hypothetical protein MI892_25190 [Desulfobacterales bacterium]|nr:hypothetical protein [Desulfobacterales bacterium]